MSQRYKNSFQFKSDHFPALAEELDENSPDYINDGRWARKLSDFLCTSLKERGWDIGAVAVEDWGHYIGLKTDSPVEVFVGCGNVTDDLHLVFAGPDQSHVRKWFKKIDVSETAENIGNDIEDILQSSSLCQDVKRDYSENVPDY